MAFALLALIAGFVGGRSSALRVAARTSPLPTPVPVGAMAPPRPASVGEADTSGISVGIVEPGKATIGDPAPEFALLSPSGESVALVDFRGHPVALNFFATWCAPCRVEMPYLQAAYENHADEGLVVLGIDVREEPEVVPPYLDELGLTFPVALDTAGTVITDYRVRTLPTTYLIDANGDVVNSQVGAFLSDQALEETLRYILRPPE